MCPHKQTNISTENKTFISFYLGAVPVDTNGHDLIQLDAEQIDDKGNKSAQSYLALTQLGMGKKTAAQSASEENNNKNRASPSLKKSDKSNSNATNGNTKDAGAGKRKTMAEMASSTLKGFAKM